MRKKHIPTVDCAGHDDHEVTSAMTSRLSAFVPSCLRLRTLRNLRALHTPAALVLLAAGLSACATTAGETIVQRPPLDVPPAPPRVITPLPVPDLPAVAEPPIEDPEAEKPTTPPKPKPAAPPKQEVKPETPPAEVTPPATPPPVAQPPQPTLTTPPPGDANAVSRQIRDSIERTRRALEKIDYGPLSDLRKKAYNDAKLFATQAEESVKTNNLVFAKELADKAEKLAKELQGR